MNNSRAGHEWSEGEVPARADDAAGGGTATGTAAATPARKGFPGLLDGTMVKWVAIATMLVDHIGAVIVYPLLFSGLVRTGTLDLATLSTVYIWMRRVGRIAFPLFCMALVEGFVHTHGRRSYAFRLFVFALVSEVPFDLAFNGANVSLLSDTNVMFTLLLAFLALWGADETCARARSGSDPLPLVVRAMIFALFLAAGAYAATLLDTDYHWFGVLLVGTLYVARRSRLAQFAAGAAMVVIYCLVNNGWLELYALAGLAVILLYNGKRGRGMKYFFYVFYPAHLLILALLRMALPI